MLTLVIGQEIQDSGITPFIRNNRTFVPLRYIMEYLGADVKWDDITRTIEIVLVTSK